MIRAWDGSASVEGGADGEAEGAVRIFEEGLEMKRSLPRSDVVASVARFMQSLRRVATGPPCAEPDEIVC